MNQPAATPAQIEDSAIQLHRDVVDILQEEVGLNDRFAHEFAAAVVTGMRKRYGGQTLGGRRGDIYVPSPGKTQRNAAIRAAFTGNNHNEVMRRFGIGRSQFYQIIGQRSPRVRERDDARN